MPPTPKLSWTEADLDELIGQSESIRREFKSGRMFEGGQESKWITSLSTEVSALANTEGGELFLGVDEDKKSKPRVATSIDGAPVSLAPERLQQLIEGNVSPYLPGIRVHRVLLSKHPGRAAFVIHVPPGSTAYQANDGRYYGRSEFEAKYLPDHEVRLRMSRGKVARGTVLARVIDVDLGVARESRIRAEAEAERAGGSTILSPLLRTALVELRAAKREPVDLEIERRRPRRTAIGVNYGRTIDFEDPSKPFEPSKPDDVLELLSATSLPDVVSLDFVFRNDGELTIRAPAVELRETRNERIFDEGLVRVKPIPVRLKLEDAIVYPGDEQTINGAQLSLEIKREVFAGGDYAMSWKVFLDNSPPSFGEIDLASLIEPARRQGIR